MRGTPSLSGCSRVARSSRVAAVVCWVAAILPAACSDSTGPSSDVTVSITVGTVFGPNITDGGAGQQTIECEADLNAAAHGTARATWRDATLYLFSGVNRSKPVDTAYIAASDVQTSWGSTDIGPGEVQQTGWRITAPVPYGVLVVYRWASPSGQVQSSRVLFNCGPAVPVIPPLPVISDVSEAPSGLEVQAGGTLTIHYVATSSLGVWATGVKVSGACTIEQTFNEGLQTRVDRTATVPLPPSCTIGGQLSFSVNATDGALQTVTVAEAHRLTVVDRTPPTVYADHLPAASDFVFGGDTISPFVAASDNSTVKQIVWEVRPFGYRDSVSGGGGLFVNIPVRSEWAGSDIQIRVFARDGVGLVSDTIVAPVHIYPSIHPPTRWASVTGDIEDVAFDDKRGAVLLIQGEGGARVGVLSLSSLTVTETIPLPALVADDDMTPGGDSLVLALPYSHALGVVDLTQSPRTVSLIPIQSFDTALHQDPQRVRIGADGKAYVLMQGPSAPAVLLQMDLATKVEQIVPGSSGIASATVVNSLDRSVLVIGRGPDLLERFDVASGTFGPKKVPQSAYGPLRTDATAATVTFGLDVYDGNLDFVRRVASVYGGDAIPGAALSTDGAYLYQALGSRGVGRARTSDGAVVDRIPSPFAASSYLRFSPDGTTLVIVDSDNPSPGSAKIAFVDLH